MANFVNITGTILTGNGIASAGQVVFQMSDLLWNTTNLYVGIEPSVGCSFDANGLFPTNPPVQLLAMDNAGFSGNWSWWVTFTIGGVQFPTRSLIVNFANGPTQDISILLSTSAVVPAATVASQLIRV